MYIHTYVHTYIHTCHADTISHAYIVDVHMHHTHRDRHTHTRTHTHTHTHTHAHAHSDTHTHTYMQSITTRTHHKTAFRNSKMLPSKTCMHYAHTAMTVRLYIDIFSHLHS